MTTRRGTSNANMRGNSTDRRRRKQNMLDHFGNGEWCVCSTCPTVLDFETMTVDCWPVPRCEGGTYGVPSDMGNVRPQCERCSWRQGGAMGARRKAARAAEKTVSLVEFSTERPDVVFFAAFANEIKAATDRVLGHFAVAVEEAQPECRCPWCLLMDSVCECNEPGQTACDTPR